MSRAIASDVKHRDPTTALHSAAVLSRLHRHGRGEVEEEVCASAVTSTVMRFSFLA